MNVIEVVVAACLLNVCVCAVLLMSGARDAADRAGTNARQ